MQSRGFRPVASRDARILILGTLPGPRSLQVRQYYAKQGNAFWPIMGRLFGASEDMDYRQRLALLKANGVALWDVCHSAYREGALDVDIVPDSIVPNDFARFLESHPRVQRICFNGRKAAQLYRTRVLPGLAGPQQCIERLTLPSTSPAHAAMRPEEKFRRWRAAFGTIQTPS
jgi:double-stranded uracil-DNA glycosylase